MKPIARRWVMQRRSGSTTAWLALTIAIAAVVIGGFFFLRAPHEPVQPAANPIGPEAKPASSPPPVTPPKPEAARKEKFDAPEPFADWPSQKPDVAFLLTGEMIGYMRPCGCSPGQHGGLARRAGLLNYLQNDKQWTVVPLDLGDIIEKSGLLENDRFVFSLESLKKLGYKVVGVGPKDLSITANELVGQAANAQPLVFTQASMKHNEKEFDQFFKEFVKDVVVIDAAGMKIAVGGVAVMPPVGLPDKAIALEPLDPTVERLLKQCAEQKADLKVLLAHMPSKDAQALAKKHVGFDLILCTSDIEDSATSEGKQVADTLVVWVGRKGKKVGVVGYFKNQKPKMRFEMIALDQRYPESDEINAIYGRFVAAIKASKAIEKSPRNKHPSGDEFVGAKACGECHTKAYKVWKESKHSHALETLTVAKPAGQEYNPECIVCHSAGFQYTSGFRTPLETPLLGGTQCENCHGPGKRHAKDSDNEKWHAQMKVTKEQFEKERHACSKCHDGENSIHFDFDKYWPKVEHVGKD